MAVTSKWRMSEDALSLPGRIGPNAVLQFLPVLDDYVGPERRVQLLARAGIFQLPDGHSMIPETQAARLHRQLRLEEPDRAPALARQAGMATGDYILRHRIPRLAQTTLRALPSGLAARLLSRAISQHAWTFVGSGELKVAGSWHYQIVNNPLIKGEASVACLCSWHEGVFARLYRSLVASDVRCAEVQCGAQGDGRSCCFELMRGRS